MERYSEEEISQQQMYAAIIDHRQRRNALKISHQVQQAQQAKLAASQQMGQQLGLQIGLGIKKYLAQQQPAKPKPTTQPVKPVKPAPPQTPKQPAPERPTAPLYQLPAPSNMAVFNWQNGGSYLCIPCARATMGMGAVDETLQQGKVQAGHTWLSRVDRCEERCSICQRRIGGS